MYNFGFASYHFGEVVVALVLAGGEIIIVKALVEESLDDNFAGARLLELRHSDPVEQLAFESVAR